MTFAPPGPLLDATSPLPVPTVPAAVAAGPPPALEIDLGGVLYADLAGLERLLAVAAAWPGPMRWLNVSAEFRHLLASHGLETTLLGPDPSP